MKTEGRQQGRRLAYQRKIQRGYTTQLDLVKVKDASAGTSRGNKNNAIGINNANAQKISYDLMGDQQLIDSHQSPPNADVKRERKYFKRALNHLKTSHEWGGGWKIPWQKREVSWLESMMRKMNQKGTLMLSCLMLRKCIQIPLCEWRRQRRRKEKYMIIFKSLIIFKSMIIFIFIQWNTLLMHITL